MYDGYRLRLDRAVAHIGLMSRSLSNRPAIAMTSLDSVLP